MFVRLLATFGVVWVGSFYASLGTAQAQNCTFTQSPMSFGAITPRTNVAFTTTATLTVNCTGNALSVVLICPNLGAGSGGASSATARQMVNGANTLNYQIYSNPGRTTVWGSYLWPYPPRAPATTILLLLGAGTANITLYGTVFAGQQGVNGGPYASDFTGTSIEYRYRYDDGNGCNAGVGTIARPAFRVSADVLPNCSVSATDIDFGARGVLRTAIDLNGSVSVACTANTPYTISLNGGQSNMAPAVRRMSKGGSVGAEFVTYGLYTDAARNQPWGGVTGGSTVAGTGTGAAVSFPVYARVPAQTTPSPGNYSDVVVVTVTY